MLKNVTFAAVLIGGIAIITAAMFGVSACIGEAQDEAELAVLERELGDGADAGERDGHGYRTAGDRRSWRRARGLRQ